MRADIPDGGDCGAGLAADQSREAAGQVALVGLRKGIIQPVGDGEPEHAVAEEFEPLVAAAAARRLADMGQRTRQKRGIGEGMPDPRLQQRQIGLRPVRAARAGGRAPVVGQGGDQWIVENRRPQRTWAGQFQICQAGVPSSIEKKIISARPTKFSNGT